MRTSLKLFLLVGLPLAMFYMVVAFVVFFFISYRLGAGLADSMLVGGSIAARAGLIGLLIGGAVALAAGLLHSWLIRKILPKGANDKATSVCQVRSVEVPVAHSRVFERCIESLSLIRGCRVQTEDRTQGKIVARTGPTWRSWGEVITLGMTRGDEEHTSVEVSSRPTSPITIVDFGKNLENVETISSFLRSGWNVQR